MKKCPACDALYAKRLSACPRCEAAAPPPSTGVPTSGWLRTRTRKDEQAVSDLAAEPPTAPVDLDALQAALRETTVRKSAALESERARETTPQAVVHEDYVLVVDDPREGTSEAFVAATDLHEESSAQGLARRSSEAWEEQPTRRQERALTRTPASRPCPAGQREGRAEEGAEASDDSPVTLESLLPAEIASEAYIERWSSEAEETRELTVELEGELSADLAGDRAGGLAAGTEPEIDLEAAIERVCVALVADLWSADDDAMDAVVAAADALFVDEVPVEPPAPSAPKPPAPPAPPTAYRAISRLPSTPQATRGESTIREKGPTRRDAEGKLAPVEVDFGDARPMVVTFAPVEDEDEVDEVVEDRRSDPDASPPTEELSDPLTLTTAIAPARSGASVSWRGVGAAIVLGSLGGIAAAWLGLVGAAAGWIIPVLGLVLVLVVGFGLAALLRGR